jgi:hypothetical protein
MKLTNPCIRSHRVGRPVPSLALAAAVAVAALAGAASAADAQYRVGANGHYNDANNGYGSGGYNSTSNVNAQLQQNNNIVTGNTTSLSYFHGNTNGEFDPNTLQINTQDGAFQSFTAISAPVNYAHPSNGASNFTPYYNAQQYVGSASSGQPPLQLTKNGVGLVPAPTVSPLTPNSNTTLQVLNNDPTDTGSNLPAPGTLDSPGPVDPVGNQSLYSMSPLYGVRQLQPNDPTQTTPYLSHDGGPQRVGGGLRMDASSIQQMRNDLRTQSTSDQPDGTSPDGSTPSSSSLLNTPGSNGTASGGTSSSGLVGNGSAVPNAGIGHTAMPSDAVRADVGSQQVTSSAASQLSRTDVTLMVPPGQQSKQLADLQKRFARLTPHPTAVQRADLLTQQELAMKANRDALAKAATDKAAATPGSSAASGAPVAPGTPGSPSGAKVGVPTDLSTGAAAKPPLPSVVRVPAADQPAISDQPFVITHLYDGIRAQGLRDLLKSAEDQMRAGQFSQAVDTYDTAGEVAPNNPFVPLGRGFAELGASYYGKAEADLTRAILSEPAVLAGQYSLKGFLGDNRLSFVRNDLTEIARTEKTARPHLLLAYIAHNDGKDDATVTAPELDAAEALGGDAKLIGLMRDAWNIKPPAK